MAEFAGAFAAGHGPNIARGWTSLKSETREWILDRYGELGRRLKAAAPDVLLVQSNDHWVNFFLDNMPAFCIGIGDEHDGPPEPFMKPVFAHETWPGHAALGRHVLDHALASEFDPSYTMRVKLDHGICVPLWQMGILPDVPVVPLFINLMEEPFPTPARCIKWGRMIREAVESFPENIRVAMLGTGGLSHSIGETTMGWIDEPFDHACMELFRSASDEKFASDLDRMLSATGNGGAELRNWLIVHAAAGGRGFDLVGYAPVPEILIGCALAEWRTAESGRQPSPQVPG